MSEENLKGDIRDEEFRNRLASLFRASPDRARLVFYDEKLGDWEVEVVGHLVGMGEMAKRSNWKHHQKFSAVDPKQN